MEPPLTKKEVGLEGGRFRTTVVAWVAFRRTH